MIELSAQVEIAGGGRRVRGKATEQRPNSYLKSNGALRGALSQVVTRAAANAVTALRVTVTDASRVVFVGSQSMNPEVGRYDFRLSDGSPFACFVRYSTGAVKSLGAEISPAELAEVCALLAEERERSAKASERRASRRRGAVS